MELNIPGLGLSTSNLLDTQTPQVLGGGKPALKPQADLGLNAKSTELTYPHLSPSLNQVLAKAAAYYSDDFYEKRGWTKPPDNVTWTDVITRLNEMSRAKGLSEIPVGDVFTKRK